MAAGVRPTEVRVLGMRDGPVSHFECAMAPARCLVGLVESSGRTAATMLRDPDWSKLATLLPLPNDRMTAKAFAQVGTTDLEARELERMGRLVHKIYCDGVTPDYKKPNTLPWDLLPEPYRQSSRDQAAHAFRVLRDAGFQIDRVDTVANVIEIPEEDVEALAEKEHGRWNFERLQTGWRYGVEKDEDVKLSPYLGPWRELPDAIQQYDRNAVRAFPKILAEGGYQLGAPQQS